MTDTLDHPLVAAAHRLADNVLSPAAETHDREGVTPEAIAAVKASGVLGVNAPAAYGGAEAPAAVGREIAETLAGACCSTFFIQAQHHTPVRTLAAGGEDTAAARERWLRPLSEGTVLAGIAFSHLRAYPKLPVRATRVAGGWRFDGRVPWYTGWGLNDVFLLGGGTEDGEVVFGVAGAGEQPGLTATDPLQLAALTGSRTVGLLLDGLVVPDEAVAVRLPHERWATEDRPKNTNTNPAVFGVARAALDLVDASGDGEAKETAGVLRERLDAARRDAYALVDEVAPAERLDDRLAAKTRAYDLMRAATTAAIAAGGGRAFGLSHPAQRLAREGLFLVVQGQTPEVRTAHLKALRS
ncbi:acyl-CoA/acyl-ACP dehydrogenase [Streptomyces sp. NBC_01795]|uniref:acyl-CoA dehydrogenase family protein n=1 Tax=unclassified Streptomyces TaxID=2593676 RepID=UPI002DD94861|nr:MULTISPECIES: acyl-CoA dehydrogenase family protein [unclassified Streptomyces]WSA94653.1 acyl-CoA/acyl-ACP dehydrogenase [Streptomyces sp. NBC_01795]WSB79072.1 acyl-CoA/acyl-ACP dehydrogenase [Streptomyces sp. NBC_01775]